MCVCVCVWWRWSIKTDQKQTPTDSTAHPVVHGTAVPLRQWAASKSFPGLEKVDVAHPELLDRHGVQEAGGLSAGGPPPSRPGSISPSEETQFFRLAGCCSERTLLLVRGSVRWSSVSSSAFTWASRCFPLREVWRPTRSVRRPPGVMQAFWSLGSAQFPSRSYRSRLWLPLVCPGAGGDHRGKERLPIYSSSVGTEAVQSPAT